MVEKLNLKIFFNKISEEKEWMLVKQCQQNENNDKIKTFLLFNQEKEKLRGTQPISFSKHRKNRFLTMKSLPMLKGRGLGSPPRHCCELEFEDGGLGGHLGSFQSTGSLPVGHTPFGVERPFHRVDIKPLKNRYLHCNL